MPAVDVMVSDLLYIFDAVTPHRYLGVDPWIWRYKQHCCKCWETISTLGKEVNQIAEVLLKVTICHEYSKLAYFSWCYCMF